MSQCKDCFHWNKITNPNDLRENKGECRRYPPVVIPGMTQGGAMVLQMLCPQTHGEYACGEYKSKHEAMVKEVATLNVPDNSKGTRTKKQRGKQ